MQAALTGISKNVTTCTQLHGTESFIDISVQVSARGKSQTSSPARKREEAERGKCTDKQRRRNTVDSKNFRRFQPTSYFSGDVVESNWGQQMFRGSLLFRWSATQMKSRRTTTMKEMKGSIGSYRTSHISRIPQTTTLNSFLGFSVWYFPSSTEQIQ